MSIPGVPQSRIEQYLANQINSSETLPQEPGSRIEAYLEYLCSHSLRNLIDAGNTSSVMQKATPANTVTTAESAVFGKENTDTCNNPNAGGNIISGWKNTVSGNSGTNAIFGVSNTLNENAWFNIVTGRHNIVRGSANTVNGQDNAVFAQASAVFGQSNTVGNENEGKKPFDSLVAGANNNCKGSHSLVLGQRINTGFENTVAIGFALNVGADNQTVLGRYSKVNQTDRLVVGSGSADNVRLNCFSTGYDGQESYIRVGGQQLKESKLATLCLIPTPPANDGTYSLKCTINSGNTTFTWVSE